MQLQKIVVPVAALVVAVAGYRAYGWAGLALVAGGLVMWQLLHFTRMLQILKRAANRPIGHVDSAVMLHAKLAAGQPLLHVVALTRSLGLLESPKDTQPERFRWTDASQSSVLCVFQGGKLQSWELTRPAPEATAAQADGPAPAP
ncbi:MAG: glycerate kinase [Curvibacter sp. RIFCSPHIGHO2_12_FULL_63_18]|uniref:glycerate kinase n=1 Tax=Rhodoferax sp. TaxID=50421 RepID=UPI0008C83741|nr:glycerate kinase [Rhodoferax sp.]OGP00354.1 MAG: glycerate kinase [Curvibacter sp. GWA2_63_95]OGP07088.1 MAG: glycerate kinase [Curvibacter sp. RIFCSPHIGHO2_12_FULL_63_18]HCX82099.1 glycerate kinase [Rhodoferax sp.]